MSDFVAAPKGFFLSFPPVGVAHVEATIRE